MSTPETVYATVIRSKLAGEAIDYRWNLSPRLKPGQTLTGTPTVSATPSGLTIGTPTINTEPFDDDEVPANTVPVGEGVISRIEAGAPKQTYELTCLCATNDGQTVGGKAKLVVW